MLKRIGLIGLLVLLCMSFIQKPAVIAQGMPKYADGAFFIENIGQYAPEVQFQGMTDLGPMLFTKDSMWLMGAKDSSTYRPSGMLDAAMMEGVAVQLRFRDANPNVTIEPIERLDTSVNYFLGSDANHWKTNVPTWDGVRYQELYPGIDLELRGNDAGTLTRHLIVSPGADVSAVAFDALGADDAELTATGLMISTPVGSVEVPFFDVVDTNDQPVLNAPSPLLTDMTLKSPVKTGNQANPPSLNSNRAGYFMYLQAFGGSNNQQISSISVVTATGELYFSGQTFSSNFPTLSPIYGTFQGGLNDGFVGKLTTAGKFQFLTFLGGSGRDYAYHLTTDINKNLLITGYTNSSNFPTLNAHDSTLDTSQQCVFGANNEFCYDAFVTRLSSNGQTLMGSTYLGGNNHDYGRTVVDDNSGAVHVMGYTRSSNFPTHIGAYDKTLAGTAGLAQDAFVAKLNSALSLFTHGTYYGGGSDEDGFGGEIRVTETITGDLRLYLTGLTFSDNLPLSFAFDISNDGGGDIYIARFTDDLATLEFGTYLGGSGADYSNRMIQNNNMIYIVGSTDSSNFPVTPNALDSTKSGTSDGFISIISVTNNTLEYSTYFGGNGFDGFIGVARDVQGYVYLAGDTTSTDIATTPNAQYRTRVASNMGLLVKFHPQTNQIAYTSYIGNTQNAASTTTVLFDVGLDVKTHHIYAAGFQNNQALVFKINTNKRKLYLPIIVKDS